MGLDQTKWNLFVGTQITKNFVALKIIMTQGQAFKMDRIESIKNKNPSYSFYSLKGS
jgi:expansin (peptidoglycan-binding protein)